MHGMSEGYWNQNHLEVDLASPWGRDVLSEGIKEAKFAVNWPDRGILSTIKGCERDLDDHLPIFLSQSGPLAIAIGTSGLTHTYSSR